MLFSFILSFIVHGFHVYEACDSLFYLCGFHIVLVTLILLGRFIYVFLVFFVSYLFYFILFVCASSGFMLRLLGKTQFKLLFLFSHVLYLFSHNNAFIHCVWACTFFLFATLSVM